MPDSAGIAFVTAADKVLLVRRPGGDPASWGFPGVDDTFGFRGELAAVDDAFVARVAGEFEPDLGDNYDFANWVDREFAMSSSLTHPRAAAVLNSMGVTFKVDQILARLESLDSLTVIHGDEPMSDRSEFVAAQLKADRVAKIYGDSAPPALSGESLLSYRARLASQFQMHSKAYKDSNLYKIGDPIALSAVEDQIYADATREATHPTTYQPGQLRAVVTNDSSGRPVTRYYGDPNACWDQFNLGVRYVRRFITAAAR
jgi:hypothetical protein